MILGPDGKPVAVEPIANADLGPPRLCHSILAAKLEFRRQERLAESGDLRRLGDLTMAWCPATAADGSTIWHWVDKHSIYHGMVCLSRDSRDAAWTELVMQRNSNKGASSEPPPVTDTAPA